MPDLTTHISPGAKIVLELQQLAEGSVSTSRDSHMGTSGIRMSLSEKYVTTPVSHVAEHASTDRAHGVRRVQIYVTADLRAGCLVTLCPPDGAVHCSERVGGLLATQLPHAAWSMLVLLTVVCMYGGARALT